VLLLAGAPGLPCPFFMFGQLCVALCEADGEGLAVADAALAAGVPVVDEVVDVVDDVVDDGEEWLVAALATAMLPPNPTPSAPAPTAVPIMILPSLDFNVSASSRLGDGPSAQDTRAGCGRTAAILCLRYETGFPDDSWGC
jgi:glycosyltransferase involved in cell wall biosynthesis